MTTHTPEDLSRIEEHNVKRVSEHARGQTKWAKGALVRVKVDKFGRHHWASATVVKSSRS